MCWIDIDFTSKGFMSYEFLNGKTPGQCPGKIPWNSGYDVPWYPTISYYIPCFFLKKPSREFARVKVVVGWRLVTPVGWGGVGVGNNFLFTLLLTRSWCYTLHLFKYLPTRSWCCALHFFKYLPARSWCCALHFFKYLPTRSWCYALHFFKYLPTRSWC